MILNHIFYLSVSLAFTNSDIPNCVVFIHKQKAPSSSNLPQRKPLCRMPISCSDRKRHQTEKLLLM